MSTNLQKNIHEKLNPVISGIKNSKHGLIFTEFPVFSKHASTSSI